jgi:hypothetical protein
MELGFFLYKPGRGRNVQIDYVEVTNMVLAG